MTTLLELQGIEKSFSGINVLKSVDLTIRAGRVVALAGENGAGKSTLMKIISGIYQRDAGTVFYKGHEVEFTNARESMDAGIGIIHQELNLLPDLSVAENIYLGREPTKLGKIQWDVVQRESKKYLAQLKQDIDPTTPLGKLSIAQQQMVEIAKALSLNAEVIIMDEPTDALTDIETAILFEVVDELRAQGKGLVFISHRLGEIFQMCDDIAILRDGQMVHQGAVADISEDDLIRHMVGRELSDQYPFVPAEPGDVRIEVDKLTARGAKEISFTANAGEVVGFAGLVGAGRTELAKAIFGANPIRGGSVKIDGQEISLKSPQDGVKAKIGYVTEDRKQEGLVQSQSLGSNMSLTGLDRFCNTLGIVNKTSEAVTISEYIEAFAIKTRDASTIISNLSGGNQQKVSIAKSLVPEPEVLILDEPTRGVDVGAKREIYTLINKLKAEGLCILLISSDMPELLGISDRILVLSDGKLTGSFDRDEATQENIMRCAVAGQTNG
ncbi:Ribose import ATP-binding protein RbsA [Pseudovibrio axinellae]|uniref:Ribose import ATP-binding protein RbsA n=1 Tax=Pseudovibrio axinellae TaxID=989403 RepID=A0A165UN19_9HYPH|nr:ATP-binding cassette domain-containing protein [Pseudovibrio axinellae]KZL12589.1 Ribose import ATP-binding protein RbsA [Pseudovibrio axinellae]SEP65499.1 ribose ABC transporter ATP-binding protein [Pseudovibrio axinellae]